MRTQRPIAVMTVAVLAGVLSACRPQSTVKPMAQLIVAQGTVQVQRQKQLQNVSAPSDLFSADVLSTGPASSAKLRFLDGKEVSLAENTRFRLEEKPGLLSLILEAGQVLTDSRGPTPQGQPQLKLIILAGAEQTQVVEGSELQFEVGPEGSTMKVLFGEAVVMGPDGQPLKVVPGDTLDLGLKTLRKPTQPIALTLSAPRGKPLRKGAQDKVFTPVDAAGSPVAEDTSFQVPPGAEAAVSSSSQARFSLLEGSQGVIGEATGGPAGETYALALEGGKANLVLPEGQKNVALTAGAGTYMLKSSEASSALISVEGEDVWVEVRTGSLAWDGQTLQPGQRAKLHGGKLEVETTEAPLFTLPFVRNVKVYADGLWEVALSLPPGEGKRHVEVARDPEFKDILVSGKTDQAFLITRVSGRGAIYWRVADGEHASAQFDADNGRSVMGQRSPKAEVAESGLKATVIFQGAPPSLTFSFQPREGASKYKVQVFRETDLRTPVAEKWVTGTTCSFPAGEIREGSYVWYAAGISAQGADLPGGKMNKLSLIYDNSRKTLAILKPAANALAKSETIQAAGVAPLGSKLYVNGRSAPLDGKGRFALALPRSEAVVFRLISRAGDEAFWVRRVRSKP